MLRRNPKGGNAMSKIGAIDWDDSRREFQYKLGYCSCGSKILATKDEVEEIVNSLGYLGRRKNVLRRSAIFLLNGIGDVAKRL